MGIYVFFSEESECSAKRVVLFKLNVVGFCVCVHGGGGDDVVVLLFHLYSS